MDFMKTVIEISKLLGSDSCHFGIVKIVDTPEGIKQSSDSDLFDHEYVDQHNGITGDDYYGFIYYPIGSGQYVQCHYSN